MNKSDLKLLSRFVINSKSVTHCRKNGRTSQDHSNGIDCSALVKFKGPWENVLALWKNLFYKTCLT